VKLVEKLPKYSGTKRFITISNKLTNQIQQFHNVNGSDILEDITYLDKLR